MVIADAPAFPDEQVAPSVRAVMLALDAVSTPIRYRVLIDERGDLLPTGTDACPPDLLAAVHGLLAVVAGSGALGRNSARVVVDTQDHCLLLYRLGADLAVVLVLDPGQNLALVRRLTEPVLTGFVEEYLGERARRDQGTRPATPARLPVRTRRAARVPVEEHVHVTELAVLAHTLDGLSELG